MRTRSVARSSGARWPNATRMLSVAVLLAFAIVLPAVLATGCTPQVQYLRSSEKVIHLKKDEPAPHDGWLLSDDQLAELYDLLERKLDAEDAARE